MDIVIDPPGERWLELLQRQPRGTMLGRSQQDWRELSRRELGLAVDRPIIATGHQTLLWHPGILAKYFATQAFADAHQLGMANLIVDQHVEGFGSFPIPVRREDGSLVVRTLELTRPRKDVPMAVHQAFTPPRAPDPVQLKGALPSVAEGVRRICEVVYAHREAENAAMQMAAAIADLMSRWVKPLPNISSSMLIQTSLAQAMMGAMAENPWKCAESYNRAVAVVPEAGIAPLLIRDDYVELPLWRIRPDGRRMHAYDADVEKAVSGHSSAVSGSAQSSISLLPRALFMTALVRLALCDLFVHGTGGARYDRAMELWMSDWLGVEVGSIAVVSATRRLPLMNQVEHRDVRTAIAGARQRWHDPDAIKHLNTGSRKKGGPSDAKARLLESIERTARGTSERRAAFVLMHDQLSELRRAHAADIDAAQHRVELAKRQASDMEIATRRDWAFPLYPDEMLDRLNRDVTAALVGSRQNFQSAWNPTA